MKIKFRWQGDVLDYNKILIVQITLSIMIGDTSCFAEATCKIFNYVLNYDIKISCITTRHVHKHLTDA